MIVVFLNMRWSSGPASKSFCPRTYLARDYIPGQRFLVSFDFPHGYFPAQSCNKKYELGMHEDTGIPGQPTVSSYKPQLAESARSYDAMTVTLSVATCIMGLGPVQLHHNNCVN